MVRWIVFDIETAEAVVDKFKRGAAEIREGSEPLDAALSVRQPSVVILPSTASGKVMLARFEPKSGAIPVKPVAAIEASRPLPGDLRKPPAGASSSPQGLGSRSSTRWAQARKLWRRGRIA
jgi:hypothetical protein